MLKSTPPSFLNNCRRALETQRNKLRKLTTQNTERIFYATDGEPEQQDEESSSLLAFDRATSTDASSVLEQRIVAKNNQALRVIERKYSIISRIYDEMSTIMHSQTESFGGIAHHLQQSEDDIERGISQLARKRESERRGWGQQIGLMLFIVVGTVIVLLVLFN
jgi:t-SNARE complex subunit (syntaxin)